MTRYPHGKGNSTTTPWLAISAPAKRVYAALGVSVIVGLAVALLGGLLFALLAERVSAGGTLGVDDAVLGWMGARQVPWGHRSALAITMLGASVVLIMIATIVTLVLALVRRRSAALLLAIATVGGLLLNTALKHLFNRPRPHIFAWGTTVSSSSFPSGHAMDSAVVYLTIAFIIAQLETRWWARVLTLLVTVAIIAAVCLSRLYLGVHYPTDVIGGVIIAVAWVGVCVSGMEWLRSRAAGRAPSRMREQEAEDRRQ